MLKKNNTAQRKIQEAFIFSSLAGEEILQCSNFYPIFFLLKWCFLHVYEQYINTAYSKMWHLLQLYPKELQVCAANLGLCLHL